jgi:hypothetical protein
MIIMELNNVCFELVPATECVRDPDSIPSGKIRQKKQYEKPEIVPELLESFHYHKLVTPLVLDCLLYFLKIVRLVE